MVPYVLLGAQVQTAKRGLGSPSEGNDAARAVGAPAFPKLPDGRR